MSASDKDGPPTPASVSNALHHAVAHGNLIAGRAVAAAAAANGIAVNVGHVGPAGVSLLQAAVRSHRVSTVQFVLGLAPPAVLAASGLLGSALLDAVMHRAPRAIIEALLLAGADPNQMGDDGHTPATKAVTLHGASHLHWVQCVLDALQDTATVHPRPNFDVYSDIIKGTVNSRVYALRQAPTTST
jgi:hypothetical protein